MSQYIQIKTENATAQVVLARPDLHNAFNDTMIQELTQAFTQLSQEPTIRVIIIAAQGKSFCAGADLNWMQSMLNYSLEENMTDATHLANMLNTIATCPKPVIGRIHGAAFGGGVGLASVCDIVVATQSATFALTEVKLGLIPAVISPFLLKKIPVSAAQRYFLTAERFSAQEAYQIGLVSNVVADEAELDRAIDSLTKSLVQNAPQAISLSKQLIEDIRHCSLEEAIPITTRRIAERRISAEGQEGMTAFLEKRPPAWQTEAPHVS